MFGLVRRLDLNLVSVHLQVDENLKIVELEVYYDTAAFLAGLAKAPKSESYTTYKTGVEGCPYLNRLH